MFILFWRNTNLVLCLSCWKHGSLVICEILGAGHCTKCKVCCWKQLCWVEKLRVILLIVVHNVYLSCRSILYRICTVRCDNSGGAGDFVLFFYRVIYRTLIKRWNNLVKELQNFWKVIKSQLLKDTWLLLFHNIYFPCYPYTGCPELSWFTSVPPGMCRDILRRSGCGRVRPRPFQFQLPSIHLCGFKRPQFEALFAVKVSGNKQNQLFLW